MFFILITGVACPDIFFAITGHAIPVERLFQPGSGFVDTQVTCMLGIVAEEKHLVPKTFWDNQECTGIATLLPPVIEDPLANVQLSLHIQYALEAGLESLSSRRDGSTSDSNHPRTSAILESSN